MNYDSSKEKDIKKIIVTAEFRLGIIYESLNTSSAYSEIELLSTCLLIH